MGTVAEREVHGPGWFLNSFIALPGPVLSLKWFVG